MPFVGSEAIKWLPFESQAPVDNMEGIVRVMEKDAPIRQEEHEGFGIVLEQISEDMV